MHLGRVVRKSQNAVKGHVQCKESKEMVAMLHYQLRGTLQSFLSLVPQSILPTQKCRQI